jgi:hypothetical protein
MLKKIIVLSVVSTIALLSMACSDDAEDACEHINEKCASQQGFTANDCAKSNDEYDKLTDAQKEQADKLIECVMDKDSCEAITGCLTSGAGG